MEKEVKLTQKQRLLEVLQQGNEVYQFIPRNKWKKRHMIDGVVDLGIANVPARIWDLRQDGYKNIETINIPHKNRYGKTHYSMYKMIKETIDI